MGFLLLNDYSMIAFSNALEALRMANYISRRNLYRWTVVDPDLTASAASNGLVVASTGSVQALYACHLVLVCGGLNVRQATTDSVLRILHRCAVNGAVMGAICTGSFALASAGLLDGYRCSTHWESLAAMIEEFPKVRFTQEVFLFERDRITCSGGTAPLHMMLHLIRGHHGAKLVMEISEQFIVERLRATKDRQRIPQPECIGSGYQKLTDVAEIMAANIEDPLSLTELASLVGLSLRQLERIFGRYFSINPAQYYLNLRLRRAQELLMHSSLPIMQITLACGFRSASHFCKAYRTLFGHAPSQERRCRA